MPKKMIVRLPPFSKSDITWVIVADKNISVNGTFDLSEANTEIYLLVPTQEVYISETKLPKLSPAQLIKAIPFTLEENLAEDINHLHFAKGSADSQNVTAVAVVSKIKMNAWQIRIKNFLKLQNPNLKMILPDVLALPWKDGQWTILIEDQNVLIRTGVQTGFAVNVEEMWTILKLFLIQPERFHLKKIVFLSAVNLPDDIVALFTKLNIETEIETNSLTLPELFAQSLDEARPLNLMQGMYKPASYYTTNQKIYFIPAALFGLCLLVLTLGSIFQYAILNFKDDQLHDLLVSQYVAQVPDAKQFTNASIEKGMQKKLDALKTKYYGSGFLKMISTVGPILLQYPDVRLTSFEFSSDQLTLAIESMDFAILEKLTNAFKQQNFSIELYEAIKTQNKVQANLVIRERKS